MTSSPHQDLVVKGVDGATRRVLEPFHRLVTMEKPVIEKRAPRFTGR